jgi:hypothetical protein
VSEEFANQSDLELLPLIKRVEEELERRKTASKDKLKEEIEEKLRSAGPDLGDLYPGAEGKGRKARPRSASGVRGGAMICHWRPLLLTSSLNVAPKLLKSREIARGRQVAG